MKLSDLVSHGRHADHLVHHQCVGDHADGGAVPGRDRLQKIGHDDAAAADHVLRHDGGVARQVRSEIAGHQSRVAVIGAADVHADHQIDGLATIEVGYLIGDRAACERVGPGKRKNRDDAEWVEPLCAAAG
jgi:hypothetical protein